MVSSTTLPDLSTVTRTATLMRPWIVPRARRGTSGMTSWSTDGDLFANGGVGRSAEAAREVDGGVGFCKTAVGGIGFDETREPRRCKPAQTATTATSSAAIAGTNKRRFEDCETTGEGCSGLIWASISAAVGRLAGFRFKHCRTICPSGG